MPLPDLTLLNLSEENLDIAAEITDMDILAAQQFAQKHLDDRYKNLLLAESQEAEEETTNG